jgi:small redox-active disulfide protein 2
MHVQVMGPGCANCTKVEKMFRGIAVEINADVEIEKVTDFQKMAMAGVFSTPAVVIDGQIRCSGRVPSKQEILAWLK